MAFHTTGAAIRIPIRQDKVSVRQYIERRVWLSAFMIESLYTIFEQFSNEQVHHNPVNLVR
jgi:hypothetical protein